MKPNASVNPIARSEGGHSQEIQELEPPSTPFPSAITPDCATDPTLSQLGRAPVRRSSSATLGALLTRPERDTEPLFPQPVTSASSTKTTLARLRWQLTCDNARPIAPDLAAELISRLRPMQAPGTTGAQARAATHADLVNRISEQDVIDWYKAQGLNEEDVAALRRTALLSGLPNPSGSFITNAMQYAVSPWLSYATRQPWAAAGFGLGTMLVTAPVNAAQQSAVVGLCESIREHGAHTIVPDKKQINDKHWLPELAQALEDKIETFAQACDMFRDILSNPGSSHQEQVATANSLLAAEKQLHQAQHDFVMTQGAHDRQWQGNRWQAIPRILRSPFASTLALLSKTGVMRALSPTAQAVGALLMTAAQHVAAGFDEQAKQEAHNKLNLLHADVLTDAGKQKLASGAAVSAQDINTDKLRSLIQSPTQILVKRVTAGVAELEKVLAETVAKMEHSQGAPSDEYVDLEAGYGSGPARDLVLLRTDLHALRDGRLDDLDPDGAASRLLIGAEEAVLSQQLLNDIAKKYNYLEFTAQTAQRIGQMFHLGVMGSAASSVINKLVAAPQGGTRFVPLPENLGISALSAGMAAIGALNQHTAICIKNNRREGSTDIGLLEQVSRGVLGAKHEVMAQRRATRASKAINAFLEDNDVDTLLDTARALAAPAASTLSTPTQWWSPLTFPTGQLSPEQGYYTPSLQSPLEQWPTKRGRDEATIALSPRAASSSPSPSQWSSWTSPGSPLRPQPPLTPSRPSRLELRPIRSGITTSKRARDGREEIALSPWAADTSSNPAQWWSPWRSPAPHRLAEQSPRPNHSIRPEHGPMSSAMTPPEQAQSEASTTLSPHAGSTSSSPTQRWPWRSAQLPPESPSTPSLGSRLQQGSTSRGVTRSEPARDEAEIPLSPPEASSSSSPTPHSPWRSPAAQLPPEQPATPSGPNRSEQGPTSSGTTRSERTQDDAARTFAPRAASTSSRQAPRSPSTSTATRRPPESPSTPNLRSQSQQTQMNSGITRSKSALELHGELQKFIRKPGKNANDLVGG